MKKLAEDFDALADDDRRLDHNKLSGTTMVIAVRPWELGIFTALRREEAGPRGLVSASARRSRR